MIRKSQLFLAIAALAGMNAAMAACNTTQWGQGSPPGGAAIGAPVAGDPNTGDADGVVKRYSGVCGLAANASAKYVQDGSPSTEASFISRFYVHTGLTTGTATVFTAMADEAADYSIFSVVFSGAALEFKDRAGTTRISIPASANRWYAVESSWTRSNSTLAVKVKGANAATESTGTDANFSVVDPGDGVDYVQFGWVSGAGTGEVTVDAYESRRSTAIGRLCRGDANGDTIYGVQDRIAMTNEILRLTNGDLTRALPTGQPDCDENGSVTVTDRICVTNFITAIPAKTCADT